MVFRMDLSSVLQLFEHHFLTFACTGFLIGGMKKASTSTYLPARRRSGAPGGRSQTPSLCCPLFSGPSSSFPLVRWIRLDSTMMTLVLPRGFQECSAAGASSWFAIGHGVVGGRFPVASLHWSRSTHDSLHRQFHLQLCKINKSVRRHKISYRLSTNKKIFF